MSPSLPGELLTAAWFLAPLAALAFGVFALAPLGAQVLARGVVFIDLAVAQSAAAAALLAGVLWHDAPWPAVQAAAALGALACAGLVARLAPRRAAEREALIGLLYVLAAAAALLAARAGTDGRERLAGLLAADVLWADGAQAALMAAGAAAVALLGRRLGRDAVFYPAFALIASLAVPVLGLFVVFAALIAPALWQRGGAAPWRARLGAVAACALGLAASWVADAPSGACVVLALAGFGLLSIGRQRVARPA